MKTYTFREVCKSMGIENNLLESAVGMTEVDCTSRKVSILDFCKKRKSSQKPLIRGRVDSLDRTKALCEFAESVVLRISCDDKSVDCKNKKQSCLNLRAVFAYGLDFHYSKIDKSILSCFYTASKDLGL
ncbi:hypothetical protein [Halobacteriovorax sp. HLS]|uniref:hypothetical protein n=1 Tax=Halobacteriovorax sp. HLS TaxID=2234000 RepID=UPI000FDC2420|nr:hypothetical protein [Halobacteriovorax sp. HLS]